MATKKILNIQVDGLHLSINVFDKTESTKAGQCAVYLESNQAGAHFYCMPDELLAIGHKIIDAALDAEKVAAFGVL